MREMRVYFTKEPCRGGTLVVARASVRKRAIGMDGLDLEDILPHSAVNIMVGRPLWSLAHAFASGLLAWMDWIWRIVLCICR